MTPFQHVLGFAVVVLALAIADLAQSVHRLLRRDSTGERSAHGRTRHPAEGGEANATMGTATRPGLRR